MKKVISLLLALLLLTAISTVAVSAKNVVNIVSRTGTVDSHSTVYAGEVIVDGESAIRYLYSDDIPSVNSVFTDSDGNKLDSISIYSGVNRAIFRKGVALTDKALQEKNKGKDPYDKVIDLGGAIDIVTYTLAGVGAISLVAGVIMHVYAPKAYQNTYKMIRSLDGVLDPVTSYADNVELTGLEKKAGFMQSLGTHGKYIAGLGFAMMIIAAAFKAWQMSEYYNRDFSAIPTMIVDKADIVSYTKDEKINKINTNIDFNQFAYYEVVRCNRQEVGIHS